MPNPSSLQDDFGPSITTIGLPTEDPTDPPGLDWYVELLDTCYPPNLYNAFKATRVTRLPA